MFGLFENKKKSIRKKAFTYTAEELELVSVVCSKILSSVDKDILFQDSIDSLVKNYGFLGSILLFKEGDELVVKTLSAGPSTTIFLKLVNLPLSSLRVKIYKESSNSIVQSMLKKETIEGIEVSDFTAEVLSHDLAKASQLLTGTKRGVSIPIIHNKEAIGALFVAKKNPEPFKEKIPVLNLISDIFGIAIINAKLLDSSRKSVVELEKKNNEISAARVRERDMMDIMGHELRTPLSIIRISNDLLSRKTEVASKKDLLVYIDRISGALERETRLLETMLTSTKIDADKLELNFEKVNVSEVIQDSFLALGSKAKQKKLQLIYTPSSTSLYVYGDRVRVSEVVDNLVLNAIKYTQKGSVTVSVHDLGKEVDISIKDTGVGIPKEDIPHLGEKFFRVGQYTKSSRDIQKHKEIDKESPLIVRPGGTGLGLYVSFGLLKAMNGKLHIESKVGKGSNFIITLPKYTNQVEKHAISSKEKDIFKRLGFTHK